MATGVGPSPPLAAGGGAWSAEAAGLTSSWATSITFFFFFFFFAPNSNCSCETQHTCTLSDHVTRQRAQVDNCYVASAKSDTFGLTIRSGSSSMTLSPIPLSQQKVTYSDHCCVRKPTRDNKFQLMHTQHPLQLERTNKTWSKKRDALLLFSE